MGGVTTLKGFRGAVLTIADRVRPGGALVWPEGAADWNPPALDALSPADFASLRGEEPALDLVLLGSGAALRRSARTLYDALSAQGMALEVMDSRAAARTYNLLAGERSDEHTSDLQSLMRISYAVFCLKTQIT